MTNAMPFPPENVNQVLELLTWALLAFSLVWLVTAVITRQHRRAYNLTHAESGGSKKIRPDFLSVDKAKREAAMARGERYDEELARREPPPAPAVEKARFWSRLGASSAAIIGLIFTALSTVQRVEATDRVIQDLGSWEKMKLLVSEHQVGAILCVAVIVANGYTVIRKMQKSGGE